MPNLVSIITFLFLVNGLLTIFLGRKPALFCGLSAFSASEGTDDNTLKFYLMQLKMLMLYNYERGKDATGIAGMGKGLVKAAEETPDFLAKHDEEIQKLISPIMIAHNRSASINMGPRKDANAHPFAYEGVTLIHNGFIENKFDLVRKYEKEYPEVFKSETFDVDSKIITYTLAATKDIKILTEYKGAANLIWMYDKNPSVLYVYKDHLRPLFCGTIEKEDKRVLFISSIEKALNTIGCKETKYFEGEHLYTITNGEITSKSKVKRNPYEHDYGVGKNYNMWGRRTQKDEIKDVKKTPTTLSAKNSAPKIDFDTMCPVTKKWEQGYCDEEDTFNMCVREDIVERWRMPSQTIRIDSDKIAHTVPGDEPYTGISYTEYGKGNKKQKNYIYWLGGTRSTKEEWKKAFKQDIDEELEAWGKKKIEERKESFINPNSGIPLLGKGGYYWQNGHKYSGQYLGYNFGHTVEDYEKELEKVEAETPLTPEGEENKKQKVATLKTQLKDAKEIYNKYGKDEDKTIIGKWFLDGVALDNEEEYERLRAKKRDRENAEQDEAVKRIIDKRVEDDRKDEEDYDLGSMFSENPYIGQHSSNGKVVHGGADDLGEGLKDEEIAEAEQEMYNDLLEIIETMKNHEENYDHLHTEPAKAMRAAITVVREAMEQVITRDFNQKKFCDRLGNTFGEETKGRGLIKQMY